MSILPNRYSKLSLLAITAPAVRTVA